MKILIVTATENEISPLKCMICGQHTIDFLVTGAGMVSTTYGLTLHLQENNYDLAINCGLAGAFDRNIAIGEMVRVKEDIFSELGAEDGDAFLNFNQMGLDGKDTYHDSNKIKIEIDLREVKGITVNTVHGNETTIKDVVDRIHPQIESMEGAAFFYVCEKFALPAVQLRSISNYVERRNKEKWNMPLALKNLKMEVERFINNLERK